MTIKIIRNKIAIDQVREAAKESFGDMAKAVVDLKRGVMSLGGQWHVQGAALLREDGSKQEDLWGVRLHLNVPHAEWIEFKSMVNIKASHGNHTMEIKDRAIRDAVARVVESLITWSPISDRQSEAGDRN
jgi:hypothetical protein